jgi:hypothetical protein
MTADIQGGDYQWGLMYADGSVRRSWNGNTQEPRERAALAAYYRDYPGSTDDVKVVRRLVGLWETQCTATRTHTAGPTA